MTATENNKHVILLKETDTDNIDPHDPYNTLFGAAQYTVRYTAPITFSITAQHISLMMQALGNINNGMYSGIVITSPRVCTFLYTIHTTQARLFTPTVLSTPVYHIYSPTTIDWLANKMHFKDLRSNPDIGDSNALAQLITSQKHTATDKPLLFICGQQRMSTLPNILNVHNVPFTECAVYDTVQKPDFSVELDKQIDVIQHTHVHNTGRLTLFEHKHSTLIYIVFFSPSGVHAYYGKIDPTHKDYTLLDSREHKNKLLLNARASNIKILSIGQTTAAALSEHGIRFDAVAEKPTAEALLRACEMCIPPPQPTEHHNRATHGF